nr:MAG TPA: hypothetical protein [Caudoviricetes sp.]
MADYKFSAVLRIRSERLINDSLKSSNSSRVKPPMPPLPSIPSILW